MHKKILFFPDVYQEHGHWHPAITLAQQLANRGHTVKFMGIADCKSIVESYYHNNPAMFHTVFEKEYPLGYTKSAQYGSVNERWQPVHLWNIISNEPNELDELMTDYNPDLIISGYFASLETLLMYYKYGKKFMITTTYLRHPDDDPGIRAIQNLTGMSEPMSRKIMEVYGTYYNNYYGIPQDAENPEYLLPQTPHEEHEESLVNPNEITVYDFVKPLERAIELIPCPRAFEFDNYLFDVDIDPQNGRVQFIEPCVRRTIFGPVSYDWTNNIPWEKQNNKKIIFATAGSQTQDYKERARRWFQEMIKMMGLQGMQDYHLVMSVGTDLIEENWAKRGELPGNVTAHSWVPQFDVLDACAVAYIHGGLATIKECIYKNVPFVVLPLGKDQMDNALRVRRTGIGQVAYAESSSHGELQHLFLQAITNSWMTNKLGKMRDLFAEMEDRSRPGVNLIIEELEKQG